MRLKLNWWIIFAIFTVHGLLSFCYKYLDWAAREHPGNFLVPFIEEMTGHYCAMALLPLVILFVERFQLTKRNWPWMSLNYLAGLIAFSAAHTTLNYWSRSVLFPVAGLGAYDYGILYLRYAMEFPGDIFVFVFMAGTVYAINFYRAARQRELVAVRMEGLLSQAQLQALRLQLQPHFLFNALNTISSVMYEDVRAADEMIGRLSEFLRLTLSGSPRQEVRLSEELRFLDLYLNIMRARFEDQLSVKLEIEGGLENALVPQLILQPLIENSIRHGVQPNSGAVDIAVSAWREAGSLQLQIRDHGRGIIEDKKEILGRGIGLANTADRLERLYRGSHTLDFSNAVDGGLVVLVSIPFHT